MACSCKLFWRDANEKLDCGDIEGANVVIPLISLAEEEEVLLICFPTSSKVPIRWVLVARCVCLDEMEETPGLGNYFLNF